MKRAYVTTPEGQIHLYMQGRGTPLLLLHQTPRSARAFAPLMQRLAGKYRCIAIDMLGFGNSDPLPPKATMADLARNTVHVMDALAIERAHILGFHTGNKIAAALAADAPERADRIVLLGMTHSLIVSRKKRDAAIMNVISKFMTAYRASPDGSHLLRRWAADYEGLAGIWWDPAVMNQHTITAPALRRQASRMVEMIQARESIKQIYEMNFGFDLAAAVRRVKAPGLVIECTVPEEAHLGAQGPLLAKLFKRGELLTLRGAAFDATETHAAVIATATDRFLRKRL